MKKLFLLLAFTGIVGAASATTLVSTKATVETVKGDDKKGDDKKKKDKKECCKKEGSAKACSGEKSLVTSQRRSTELSKTDSP